MIQGTSAAGAIAARAAGVTPADRDAALREVCAQFEGVFVNEMLKVMRSTVPEGGVLDGGAGEDIFTGLFDQHLASAAASRSENGLGAALYRRLRPMLGQAAPAEQTATLQGRPI